MTDREEETEDKGDKYTGEREGKEKRRYSGKVEGKNGCKGTRKERGGRERG